MVAVLFALRLRRVLIILRRRPEATARCIIYFNFASRMQGARPLSLSEGLSAQCFVGFQEVESVKRRLFDTRFIRLPKKRQCF